jgi:hypothetical protein
MMRDELDVDDVLRLYSSFADYARTSNELWPMFTEMSSEERTVLFLAADLLDWVGDIVKSRHGETLHRVADADDVDARTDELVEVIRELEQEGGDA